MDSPTLATLLERAIQARHSLVDPAHEAAYRVFNGFHEGEHDLAIDIYGTTAVIHDYAESPGRGDALAQETLDVLRARLPWLRCVLRKTRTGSTPAEKRGRLVFGTAADTRVREHGVLYAIDLTMNRDASLYLDTRDLRCWAIEHLSGKSVLNTFAYTGSLGVAALAGGAAHVAQLDLNSRFLKLAAQSCELNGFASANHELITGDFFPRVSQLKRAGRRFDCVILDPPLFSTSGRGTVDLENSIARLINKVRPLIQHDGWLVVVNNALFVSGTAFQDTLATLCADGYLAVETLVPVPEDFTGYPETIVGSPVTDPAPFNHSTKIAVLRVRRKTG